MKLYTQLRTRFSAFTPTQRIGVLVLLFFLLVLPLVVMVSQQQPQTQQQAAGTLTPTVNIWETTADQSKLLTLQTPVNFAPDNSSTPLTITLDETQKYQQMDGLGASFTDSSAWLVGTKMTSSQRNQLMTKLFDSVQGAGISFLRQPMGASDFTSIGPYSYDDMPAGQTDPNLDHFSIDHDKAYIIPLLKQAMQINPKLKILASPWSPPAWMKSNGSMLHGGSLKTNLYGTYAHYFVKYIQAYQAQGIPIDLVTVQNEPQANQIFPSAIWSAADEANFVGNYLGPAFVKAGIPTKIVVWDHNWDNPGFPQQVLSNPNANQYIDGTAYHCYAGTVAAQNTTHTQFPNKNMYFTECSGLATASFASDLHWNMENLIIGAIRNWAKSVVKWNIALDPQNGPTIGCRDCRGVVTIDPTTGNVTYNVEYYFLGQAGKVVIPGAYRIASNTFNGSIEDVAFLNPDGSKAVIVFNAATSQQTFKIRWQNQAFTYTLPAGALASFKWNGARGRTGMGICCAMVVVSHTLNGG